MINRLWYENCHIIISKYQSLICRMLWFCPEIDKVYSIMRWYKYTKLIQKPQWDCFKLVNGYIRVKSLINILACWVTISADDSPKYSSFLFSKNRIWHFMQIVSHEMSNSVLGKNKKSIISLPSGESAYSVLSVNKRNLPLVSVIPELVDGRSVFVI